MTPSFCDAAVVPALTKVNLAGFVSPGFVSTGLAVSTGLVGSTGLVVSTGLAVSTGLVSTGFVSTGLVG